VSAATNPPDNISWDRLQRGALVTGVAALGLCALAALLSPADVFRSYLVAYHFWLGIGLGSLVILMLQYLTGGTWGLALRRLLESGASTLPLLALLFLPLFLGAGYLFSWTREDQGHRGLYLNLPFFLARAVLYFGCWIAVSYFLNRWSREETAASPTNESSRRFRILSAPGLVLYGITITFASIDWAMSLEPGWASTIYPALVATGQVLTALAFVVIVLALLSRRESVGPAILGDLGNLLLTFVMFWAYMAISQFLLIWTGNLPEENVWYLRRLQGGWQWVAIGLVGFQFSLPFLLLLSRDVKRNPRTLAAVAGLILAMRFLDVLWWIEPAFGDGVSFYRLLDVLAVAGLGGLWVWWFLWQLQKRPFVPLPVYSR
jgi:hypothetical protein